MFVYELGASNVLLLFWLGLHLSPLLAFIAAMSQYIVFLVFTFIFLVFDLAAPWTLICVFGFIIVDFVLGRPWRLSLPALRRRDMHQPELDVVDDGHMHVVR